MPRIAPIVVLACSFACALLAGANAASAAEDGGTRSPLMMGSGGRPLAMGGAAAALSDDAYALFWNPARLSAVQQSELSLFRTQLFADDLVYQAGFFSYPSLDFGSFALGYQRLGAGGIDLRDDRNLPVGEADFSETNLLLGYGRQLNRNISVGANFRLAQQDAGSASATGLGVDLAAAFQWDADATGRHRWGIGANLQNLIEPTLQLEDERVPDTRSIKLGLAYWSQRASFSRLSWAAALDVDLPTEGGTRLGAGAELGLDGRFFLRGGVDDGRPTFGFGLDIRGVHLDYALRSGSDLSRNDLVTLGLRFGSTLTQRRAHRLERQRLAVREELESLLTQREDEALRTALREATTAFDAEDWDESIVLYRRVLLLDPAHEQAPLRIDEAEMRLAIAAAQEQLATGDLARAAAALQGVVDRWPDENTQQQLADVRRRLRDSVDRSRQVASLFSQAMDEFTAGSLVAAERSLDELLRLDEANDVAIELRDRVLQRRHADGARALEQAQTLASAGRWTEARRQLARSQKLLPERASEFAALEDEWMTLQLQAEKAREASPLAVAQSTTTQATATVQAPRQAVLSAARARELEARFQSGMQSFNEGDFESATHQWQRIWDEQPTFKGVGDYLVKAYLYQGVRLYSDGEYQAALERCQRVLQIDPDNPKAKRYLASIEEERANVQELWERAR